MSETSTTSRNQRKHANRKALRDEKLLTEFPRIELWVFGEDRYGGNVITGTVYNHRIIADKENITTSPIVRMGHLFAITLSGSKYILGTPKKEYIDYREKHNLGPISHKVFRFDP